MAGQVGARASPLHPFRGCQRRLPVVPRGDPETAVAALAAQYGDIRPRLEQGRPVDGPEVVPGEPGQARKGERALLGCGSLSPEVDISAS